MNTLHDNNLRPLQLMASAMAGWRIAAPKGPDDRIPPAFLSMKNARFEMCGPSGEHYLDAASTDANRLHAHWQGFKQSQKAAKGARNDVDAPLADRKTKAQAKRDRQHASDLQHAIELIAKQQPAEGARK